MKTFEEVLGAMGWALDDMGRWRNWIAYGAGELTEVRAALTGREVELLQEMHAIMSKPAERRSVGLRGSNDDNPEEAEDDTARLPYKAMARQQVATDLVVAWAELGALFADDDDEAEMRRAVRRAYAIARMLEEEGKP